MVILVHFLGGQKGLRRYRGGGGLVGFVDDDQCLFYKCGFKPVNAWLFDLSVASERSQEKPPSFRLGSYLFQDWPLVCFKTGFYLFQDWLLVCFSWHQLALGSIHNKSFMLKSGEVHLSTINNSNLRTLFHPNTH